jgi:transitional endoplasmic reticulum ATPase
MSGRGRCRSSSTEPDVRSAEMWGEEEAEGQVARVRAIADDRRQMHIQYRSGVTGRISSEEQIEFDVGDVLLVDAGANYVERAPDSLWPEDTWIGILSQRVDGGFVALVDGHYRFLPSTDSAFSVGNTVEGRGETQILRVLHENPVRIPESAGTDDGLGEAFLAPEGEGGDDFSDFGGLHEVVERAKELIELPLKHQAALQKIGARRIKGVLFTGPPGTGKTMLARIIANRAEAKFYEIRGPEIFGKWYGESEGILRGIFGHASKQKSSIIFFDEIDSVATQRAESHEASRRVVAQLLSLMDGFTPDENVMVIATTNRPQDIDGALRRPGRLDWEITFPLPGLEDRKEILEVWGRNLNTVGVLPHDLIAAKTEMWSSAELAAIWTEAALIAVADSGRDAILAEDYVGGYERVASLRLRSIEAMARENQEK